ncbi:MAG: tyrosine--tRNA ligase [Candidatus Bipolaricaulota bacterium]|nr:tyrosine--tRNA ligase [Candidatus Bipolaricaulota bacterium]MBS3791919.1 tyrosine--tRNA ligase [Candidatus Bipolaricaulota bacterium]
MVNNFEDEVKKIKSGTADLIPEKELADKLKLSEEEDRPLRVKLGVDPSSPDLTLGHAVVLRKLRQLQDLGHKAVMVVGDFTRRIGDPSGRSETREIMDAKEIEDNMKDYEKQVFRILDPEKTEFRYNSEWLGKLTFEDIIELTSKYTVARMLERDDFSNRYENNKPISILEFLYPLAQAYDSVAVDADIELGGADQRFNLIVGRHIQREFDQEPQIVLTVPLLTGTDGTDAMSQTRGNYIGINEAPETIYGKIMSITDETMPEYFELLTDLSLDDLDDLHPKDQKKELAYEIVSNIYSEVEANHAEEEFETVFEQNGKPEDLKEVKVPADRIKEDGTVWILDLLEVSGFVSSRSEARRLIDQGGVRLDDDRVTEVDFDPPLEDERILQVGKKKFARLVPESG